MCISFNPIVAYHAHKVKPYPFHCVQDTLKESLMTNVQKLITTCFLSFLLLLLLPLLSLVCTGNGLSGDALYLHSSSGEATVTVLLQDTGKAVVMSETEYVCGAVACEMPLTYEDEALKAQAVIALTQLRRQQLCTDTTVSGSDKLAAISDGSRNAQGCLTASQRKAAWGTAYPQNEARLRQLVASVAGEYLAYEGQPILAAYHAISCGTTESASNVWGSNCPYLLPVSSSSDPVSEEYHSSVTFSPDEFRIICKEKLGILPNDSTQEPIGTCTRSSSGYVTDYEIYGTHINGQKIRNAFGLRSACFTLKYMDGRFLFAVRGWGHGVGMSQYGANEMARQGAGYQAILTHYYPGASIVKGADASA